MSFENERRLRPNSSKIDPKLIEKLLVVILETPNLVDPQKTKLSSFSLGQGNKKLKIKKVISVFYSMNAKNSVTTSRN